MGMNLCDLWQGYVYLDKAPKPQETKEKREKLDYIKIKNFCAANEATKKVKNKLKSRRKYL